MARFYAQVFTAVFLVVTVGGLLLGDAGPANGGTAGGSLGPLTLHMTWARDALDAALLVADILAGFVLGRTAGKRVVIGGGVLLVALAVAGLLVGDDDAASKGALGMHFPVAINLFDLVAGALGVLAGLGTLADHEL